MARPLAAAVTNFSLDQLASGDIRPDSFIVKFQKDPSEGTNAADRATFDSQMKSKGIPYTLESAYDRLFNGVSIEVEEQYLDAIMDLSIVSYVGVNHITNVDNIRVAPASPPGLERRATGTQQPAYPLLGLEDMGIAQLKKSKGLTGKGVKVGFVDSGLDYLHPAFGGSYKMTNSRVKYGYDFVGDDYTGFNAPVPDDDPKDTCNGHGTHVAGIAVGNDGVFQGVAHEATIGAYRVIGCTGASTISLYMAGLERAYKDGMNIINLSMGTPSGWSNWAISEMVERLTHNDVAVVAAAGNDGADTLFNVNAPSVAPTVYSVAWVDSPQYYRPYMNVTFGTEAAQVDRSPSQHEFIDFVFNGVEIARDTSSGGDPYGCKSYGSSVAGKVVFALRGYCALQDKAVYAEAAGAVGIIIGNTDTAKLEMVAVERTVGIPVVAVEKSWTDKFAAALSAGTKITMSSDLALKAISNASANRVSPFSSWGPTALIEPKPDIGAYGYNVWSTISRRLGYYGFMSGTSMATPFVSGSLALLYKTGFFWDYDAARRSLIQSAVLTKDSAGRVESFAHQGYGLLNMTNYVGRNMDISHNHFMCLDLSTDYFYNGVSSWYFYIKNKSSSSVTYKLSHTIATSVSIYNADWSVARPPRVSASGASVTFSTTSVTVPPSGSGSGTKVNLSIKLPSSPTSEFWIYSGYIQVTPTSGSYRVTQNLPYIGMNGLYRDMPLFTEKTSLPLLVDGATGNVVSNNGTKFTMSNGNIPVVAFQLVVPTKRIRIKVVRAGITTPFGSVEDAYYDYFQRNVYKTTDPYWFYSWQGGYYVSATPEKIVPIPNGQWQLQFSFARGYGKSTNFYDGYHIWYSPVFEVAR
ncbi:hypothetical protein H4R35_000396 [Dimargaris xerosporica]|nr:hypothetical protein H4R35_000396 [Dimargaris xerosporica]